MRAIPLILALLVGCPSEDPVDVDCSDLSANACEADPACGVIGGREVDTDAEPWCVDFSVSETPMGCDSIEQDCNDVETLAAPPDDPDRCVWFSDSCVPQGWSACGPGSVGECPADG